MLDVAGVEVLCVPVRSTFVFLISDILTFVSLGRAEDFSRKYIWPNTYLPTPAIIINAINTATHGRFILDGVENHAFRKYSILSTQIPNPKC